MALSDNISVVALVISLIALILTLLSMTQSFLGTAEGYRRCADTVIDQWSKFRHRHWIWYEFRFETQYITPQIILASPAQIQSHVDEGLRPRLLNDDRLDPKTVLYATMHANSSTSIRRSLQSTQVKSASGDSGHLEKVMPVNTKRPSSLTKEQEGQLRKEQSKQEMLVSWLKLLKELHGVYFSYWPRDCTQCARDRHEKRLKTGWSDGDSGLVRTNHNELPVGQETVNTDRTDVAVIYRMWTWDFMPPDTVKPLAESTIGDIVVLARRLGMQWRTLRLSEGVMQADGNGYALSSTDTKNLGMVFKFSVVGQPKRFPRLIPSVAADKMMCGILPGDPEMVGEDFDLVKNDADRSLLNVDEPGGILERIGLARVIIDGVKEDRIWEPQNEVIMLLCPFMPLQQSTIAAFTIDGFLPNSGVRQSTFGFWEGRCAFLKALEMRMDECEDHTRLQDLQTVHKHLRGLRDGFHEDFFSMFDKAAIGNHKKVGENKFDIDDTGNTKLALIKKCREIFDDTSDYFKKHRLHEKKFEGRTWYTILVAAHFRMANDAYKPIFKEKYKNKSPPSQQELSHQHTENFPFLRDGQRGPFIIGSMFDYVKRAVLDKNNNGGKLGVHHFDFGIQAFFDRRGISFSDDRRQNADQCEALWWYLVLRGIAWEMANRSVASGGPVSPIFYGNKTPVWLT